MLAVVDFTFGTRRISIRPAGTTYANPHVSITALVPYKDYSQILTEVSRANSRYNSLQVFWNRRFISGLSFSAACTLSKSMDNSSSYSDIVPDTYDTSNLWGPSTYDVRDAFVGTFTYDVPFLREQHYLTGKLLGGWQLSGTAQYLSGSPGSVYSTNTDYAGAGEAGLPQFWVMHGKPSYPRQLSHSATSSTTFFRTVTLAVIRCLPHLHREPSTCSMVFEMRSMVLASRIGMQGCSRNLPSTNATRFEFHAEAYDVFNHPN